MPRTAEALIEHLIATNALRTPRIIDAFRRVDRALFVPKESLSEAYGDYPLPIGEGQTISQPTTVAHLMEWLSPRADQRVLDVGSGSGWTTALLAHMVGSQGRVFGVERVPSLVRFGRKNLAKRPYTWASIQAAGATLGLPAQAPYNRILVSAAAKTVPDALVQQLRPDGLLVVPVRDAIHVVHASGREDVHHGYRFVPLKHNTD